MNNLGLGFTDLFSLYRLQGRSLRESLRLAWQYRNFQPDHAGSRAMRAWQLECEQNAKAAADMNISNNA